MECCGRMRQREYNRIEGLEKIATARLARETPSVSLVRQRLHERGEVLRNAPELQKRIAESSDLSGGPPTMKAVWAASDAFRCGRYQRLPGPAENRNGPESASPIPSTHVQSRRTQC
jgi:hypothetical protein